MRLKEAEKKLTVFLRESNQIHSQAAPDVIKRENTELNGKRIWILHTIYPENGIYIVSHGGTVRDFYEVPEH